MSLTNSSIDIKIKAQESGDYYSYAGGLIGYSVAAKVENVRINGSTITSSSDTKSYAGGLAGYDASNNSEYKKIVVVNSTITSNNTHERKVSNSKAWIGFKYSEGFDKSQYVSYSSQGIGNLKIDNMATENNIVQANVIPLNQYQDTDDYQFEDFITSIYATGKNGGTGSKNDRIKLKGKDDEGCVERISASYCVNNGDLLAQKRRYYLWTDSNHNPDDRYKGNDGTIRTRVCGVRTGGDFLLANLNDDDIISESNFTGTWKYTESETWVSGYKVESTKSKRLYVYGDLSGNGHLIWIKTSYLNYEETVV